jgi:hypothetical protein
VLHTVVIRHKRRRKKKGTAYIYASAGSIIQMYPKGVVILLGCENKKKKLPVISYNPVLFTQTIKKYFYFPSFFFCFLVLKRVKGSLLHVYSCKNGQSNTLSTLFLCCEF